MVVITISTTDTDSAIAMPSISAVDKYMIVSLDCGLAVVS
jgi:hypothetical protein